MTENLSYKSAIKNPLFQKLLQIEESATIRKPWELAAFQASSLN